MSSGIVYVTKLDYNGLPSEPPKARKATEPKNVSNNK
jgi:hypothetical protein